MPVSDLPAGGGMTDLANTRSATAAERSIYEAVERAVRDAKRSGAVVPLRPADSAPEAAVASHDWQEPRALPDGLLAVASFDLDLMPAAFRPWVADISERVQCAPDFVAVTAMAALGTVLGRKVGIRPQARTDWTEVANQWALVIGRPGVLKSPAIEQALAPLRRLEANANQHHEAALLAF